MLPESAPLARPLIEYVFDRLAREAAATSGAAKVAVGGGSLAMGGPRGRGDNIELLILEKQRKVLAPIIADFGFQAVHVLDEEYYGGITRPASRAFLLDKAAHRYARVFFPFNTFRANAYLFGAIVAQEAVAINASLLRAGLPPKEIAYSLDAERTPEFTLPWLSDIQEIRSTLKSISRVMSSLDKGGLKVSGERPNLGLLGGFGHDLEIFMKYASGMEKARGRKVLDIGGGLGYGAFLLSRTAEEVVYLDKSQGAADFVRKTWSPLAQNLTAICGEAKGLVDREGYFDVVFLMDVIEHAPDPESILAHARRLLRPGGLLVLSTPEEDYYPYRVCPPERRGEDEARLIEDAIWPWHIQALGEARMLPMLKEAGFTLEEKNYITYVRGREIGARLKDALLRDGFYDLIEGTCEIIRWDILDFGLSTERDPCFSAASYNVTARKES